jgi:ketosteroid isomerase-like protein
MNLETLAEDYFEAFSHKDLDTLALMFHDDVELRDWDISAEGIDEVLEANKKIFDSVTSIKVTPDALYNDGDTVIAELSIDINDDQVIWVVDVIKFENDLIKSIRAYKG